VSIKPSPSYEDLNRTFFPIDGKQAVNPDEIEAWGRYYGTQTWKDLRSASRVVILAEASSGKTEEFRNQVHQINQEGGFAFFAAIEQLARTDFSTLIGHSERPRFEEWKKRAVPAWFFLDSLDEAKLNNFSLDAALNALTVAVGSAYDRAHLVISSRGTDWDGEEDLQKIVQFMPAAAPVEEKEEGDEDFALTSALNREKREDKKKPSRPSPPVAVVAMARLSPEQRKIFLTAKRVSDIAKFELALFRQGLIPLAERPGDLALLEKYWKANGRFGSLREMTENSIKLRLSERDGRPDAAYLTPNKARRGAERLAAAMTLGRRLTLWSGKLEEKADDALDPNAILPDWSRKDVKALLRRGLFAPASYGQVRFHHRSVIEYLTARWFERLLAGPRSPSQTILDIFTSPTFGVATVPPPYRPAAAWLAHKFEPLRTYIIQNEPLTLLSYGDPASFPIATREHVLLSFASRDRDGNVGDHTIDAHALWMFADKHLTSALREAWASNCEEDFHFELLRLIELGEIAGCEDLITVEALDSAKKTHNRILAARALNATNAAAGLRALAEDLVANGAKYGPRLAPELAVNVFPKYLPVGQLIRLIEESPPARRYQVEGFGYVLDRLYDACRTKAERKALLVGLGRLGETPPLEEFHHTSVRHATLLKRLAPLLQLAIAASDVDGIDASLVKLLAIAGRSDFDDDRDAAQRVQEMIKVRPRLKRALFWEDVRVNFKYQPDDRRQPRVWWLIPYGRRLWSLDGPDKHWLEADINKSKNSAERRMGFSALYAIASVQPDKEDALDRLAERYRKNAALSADLVEYRTPRPESEAEQKFRVREAAMEAARNVEFSKNAAEWKAYRARLRSDPSVLTDTTRLKRWPGPNNLHNLTRWLAMKTDAELKRAPTEYKKLGAAFGSEIRDAYVAGMKAMWRITKPEAPTYLADGRYSEKKVSVLAVGGLNLEAADPAWLDGLSPVELKRAAQHVTLSNRDATEWLSALIAAAPAHVAPIILKEIRAEWSRPSNQPAPFLSRCESSLALPKELQAGLWKLLREQEVADPARVSGLTRIVRRLALDKRKTAKLTDIVLARMAVTRPTNTWEWSSSYLALLFELDIDKATEMLIVLLEAQPEEIRKERSEQIFGAFFGMSRGLVWGLETATPPQLARLLRLAYQEVSPRHDQHPEGIHSKDTRDDAQDGRSRILSALCKDSSEEAYRLIVDLASDPVIGDRGHRFHQLAHGMAERAAEKLAWGEGDVVAFEETLERPIRTGQELLNLACELIDQINHEIAFGDFSVQPLLQTATNEFAVQNWLATEYNRQSHGRFTTAREKQVKSDKRPDIALTAAETGQEVAIEIKHGEMDWTMPELRDALGQQLAATYLLPATRRSGLLVITNHRANRFWLAADKAKRLSFSAVLGLLHADAQALIRNSAGYINLQVRGIDASSPNASGPSLKSKSSVAGAAPAAKRASGSKKRKKAMPRARMHVGPPS